MDLNGRSAIFVPHLLKDGTLDLGEVLGRVEVLSIDQPRKERISRLGQLNEKEDKSGRHE
jgi:hypothetical protein